MLRDNRDGTDRDRKRSYEDRYPDGWKSQGYNGSGAAALSPRKNTRFSEVPYDRPSNRRPAHDDRNEREGPPPASRRRYADSPSSPRVRLHSCTACGSVQQRYKSHLRYNRI